MKKKIRAVVVGLGVAIPLVFGAATANAAGSSPCISTAGAIACYQPNGDYFSAYDTAEDGHSVRTYWSTSNGQSGVCPNTDGYGSHATCNQYIPHTRGTVVRWRATVYEGSTQIRQSVAATYTF